MGRPTLATRAADGAATIIQRLFTGAAMTKTDQTEIRFSEHLIAEISLQLSRVGYHVGGKPFTDLVRFLEDKINESGEPEINVVMPEFAINLALDSRDTRSADAALRLEFMLKILHSRRHEESRPILPYSTVEVSPVEPATANANGYLEWLKLYQDDDERWRVETQVVCWLFDKPAHRAYRLGASRVMSLTRGEIAIPAFAGKNIGLLIFPLRKIDDEVVAINPETKVDNIRFTESGLVDQDKEQRDAAFVMDRAFSERRTLDPIDAADRLKNADFYASRWNFNHETAPELFDALFRYHVADKPSDMLFFRLPKSPKGDLGLSA